MRLLHVGLCANGHPYNGLQEELSKAFDYKEISCSRPDLNQKMIDVCQRFNPEIIFIQVQSPGIILKETLEEIKKQNVFIIHWTGDVRKPIPQFYIDLAPFVDVTCFTNMIDVEMMRYKGFNSEFLQIGFDPEIFKPQGAKIKSPEIIFLGNNYGKNAFPLSQYRIDIVGALRKEFGNRFGVYGNGWSDADGVFGDSQISEAALYRGCKIAINCSHFDYYKYFSDRMIRMMGSGAFCLSHDYKGWSDDFSEDDIAFFGNIDYLIEQCHYYLENEEKRKQIAEHGCNTVHSKFTYKHMVENIKKIYDDSRR